MRPLTVKPRRRGHMLRRAEAQLRKGVAKVSIEVPVAREVLKASGLRALLYRYRRGLEVRLSSMRQIQLPVAFDDVIDADWTRPAPATLAPSSRRSAGGSLVISWVLPPVVLGSGGHTTIFRFVRHLEAKGHTCRLYFYNPRARTSFREQVDTVRAGYKPMRAEILRFARAMEPCDAVVATMWPTAYAAFNSPVRARRFYFVQDYEPYFYPVGTDAVLAANTYRFGFHGVTAGQWLSTKLTQEYGMPCDHFDFGVDGSEYFNEGRGLRPGVVFYARPSTPRRGFALGVMTLKLFHERHPEYQIHMIGRNLGEFGLPFPFINHGVLSHEHLNRLYNACSAGLVISLTNMSLMPVELLATGCIPIVNDAPNNRMVGGSSFISYAEPSPHSLAGALCDAVERADRHAYAEEAAESVRALSWDDAGDKVESIFVREAQLSAA